MEFKTVEELLSDPARWTKRTGAKAADGTPVSVASPDACCFCLIGALNKVYGHGIDFFDKKTAVVDTLKRLHPHLQSLPGSMIMYWNDDPNTTHADVLEVVREAHV